MESPRGFEHCHCVFFVPEHISVRKEIKVIASVPTMEKGRQNRISVETAKP